MCFRKKEQKELTKKTIPKPWEKESCFWIRSRDSSSWNITCEWINRSDIKEYTENGFVVERFEEKDPYYNLSIEFKDEAHKLLKKRKYEYSYDFEKEIWVFKITDISCETLKTYSSLDSFKALGNYKLIETEEECEDYINSSLSCDDWCRIKLVRKMQELNLGVGFITAFADLIDTDLDKYKMMCQLSKECNDRDILMYMLVHKFGGSRWQK